MQAWLSTSGSGVDFEPMAGLVLLGSLGAECGGPFTRGMMPRGGWR